MLLTHLRKSIHRDLAIRHISRQARSSPNSRPCRRPFGSKQATTTVLALILAFGIATTSTSASLWDFSSRSRLLLTEGDDNSSGWFTFPRIIGQRDSKDEAESLSKDGANEKNPPPQTRSSETSDQNAEESADFLTTLKQKLAEFPNLGDAIGDAILPSWVWALPGYIRKLQSEMSMALGSLADEIWREAHDPEVNPEIIWDAKVRISQDLCPEELMFLRHRKLRVRQALSKYIDVPFEDIHPDDIPTIAICGSGGGLRALVAGTSSFHSAAQDGLFDCATYTAGVSGSCWLQTLFYSSIGQQNHGRMLDHLKHRLGVHIAFPPSAFGLLTSAPTNKYLLSGVVEKLRGIPDADFGLVDIYGLLLAGRLMVPKGELAIDYYDLKVSDQCRYVDKGAFPLPIYTAVRHEIPDDAVQSTSSEELKQKARKEAWFQWFEWTPYEFFCEELEAGIPTWAVGRPFQKGRTSWRDNGLALPELRMPILMGIWGSAFCATLSHYYKEIRPILAGMVGFKGFDELISQKDEDLIKLHPFDPATIPNFALNMEDQLPTACPKSIHNATHLQLMDAGMSNNLPIYPLLRPGREVDIIVAFDASADVKKDNWLKVTDGYVRQRNIKGWPMGSGWPSEDQTSFSAALDLEKASANTTSEAEAKMRDAKIKSRQSTVQGTTKPSSLGYCSVWVGSKQERVDEDEPPASKQVERDWELMSPDAGITVVYFPLMANDGVEGVDPQVSDFLSTWNFVYTPEEIDKVVNLAKANFEAGKERTRRTVKAVWQRKRQQRLSREQQNRDVSWALANGRTRFGDQGDHFS